MGNNAPILEVRDLLKTFGAVVAAKDINVDISKGEVVGIIGANGAGKTCFVNMVTGYLAPTEGSIKFEGHELVGRPVHGLQILCCLLWEQDSPSPC